MSATQNKENEKGLVYTFSQYNETKYSVNADGKFEAQEWSYYKDYHPAKYDVCYEKLGFTWVIKHKEEKVLLVSGYVAEDTVKELMNSVSKGTTIKETEKETQQETE